MTHTACVFADHRCPKRPREERPNNRIHVEFWQSLGESPYSLTQARAVCEDCGQGIAVDVIFDVKVQKTVSVVLSHASDG